MGNGFLSYFIKSWIFLLLAGILYSQEVDHIAPLYLNRLTIQDGLSSQKNNDNIFKDSQGFVWISSVDGLNRFDGHEIRPYYHDPSDSFSISSNIIYSTFFEDKKTDIWFSTALGVHRYVRENDHFERIPLSPALDTLSDVRLLYMDSEKEEIWVSVGNQLYIKKIDPLSDHLHYLGAFPIGKQWRVSRSPFSDKGFYLMGPRRNQFIIYHFVPDISSSSLKPPNEVILPFTGEFNIGHLNNDGQLWVGGRNGLLLYDLQSNETSSIPNTPTNIFSFAEGESNTLWLGSEEGGVYFFDPKTRRVSKPLNWLSEQEIKAFNYKIEGLHYFADHSFWVSSPGRGVFFTNFKKRKFRAFLQKKVDGNPAASNIQALAGDSQNRIWALHAQGLSVLNSNGEHVKEYNSNKNRQLEPGRNLFFHIFCDKEDGIWVSSQKGLFYLSSIDDNFQKIDHRLYSSVFELSDGIILATRENGILEITKREKIIEDTTTLAFSKNKFYNIIFQDEKGHVYLGEMTKQLVILDWASGRHKPAHHITFEPMITNIVEDKDQDILWIGTKGGLYSISTKGEKPPLIRNDLNRGLFINGIQLADSNLFISTNKSLLRYDTILNSNLNFSIADGLQGGEFNFNSSVKLKNGMIAFGGINGLNIFDPTSLHQSPLRARPVITAIKIGNKSIQEWGISCASTEATNPELIKSLKLKHDQNTLQFSFAALEYSDPRAVKFRFRLLGQDKDWVELENSHITRYSDLPHGNYSLQLLAINSDGVVSEDQFDLKIIIHPPWYRSTLAFALWILVGLGIIYLVYWSQLKRKLRIEENKRLKELDEFKNRFFTNITHELKSPITSVMTSAQKSKLDEKDRVSILRRSDDLLQIINRILGLARLKSGKMQLTEEKGDLVQFLNFQLQSYSSLASDKDIKLEFKSELEELIMDFDDGKLKDLIRNLLSNALKYNRVGGLVQLTLEKESENQILIKVKDTGTGISQNELDKIFKRFYSGENGTVSMVEGTGIGLSYVKELVSFLGGTISAKSEMGTGSEFFLKLPFANKESTPLSKVWNSFIIPTASLTNNTLGEGLPVGAVEEDEMTVLIVEDDKDILENLLALLKNKYNILFAVDGETGIQKAIEEMPDLIISDVMMPRKNGFELCESLKTNKITSHIPIILLTALDGQNAKNMGLQHGADAYLSKPFNEEELFLRLKNLMDIRKAIQNKYGDSGEEDNSWSLLNDSDQEIMTNMRRFILENLSTVNVEILAKELGLTRNQLYNKVKAIAGISCQSYITKLKVEKGRRLILKHPNLTISEIAFEIGFKNVAHFSNRFKERFGYSPSELQKKE